MIIYKNKISTIEYDVKRKNITYNEHGFAKKELLIQQLKAVMDFSKTHPIVSTIVDFRKLHGSFKNVFDYLNSAYFPVLKSQGLKCKAFIITEDIISTYLTNDLIIDLRKKGINAESFSNMEAASKWVSQFNELVAS